MDTKTERVLTCNRDAQSHSGALRKDGDGYVCAKCYDEEHDIERKKGRGRAVTCSCGEVLMRRYRNGGVSIDASLDMGDGTTKLICKCGRSKTIKNPFGGQTATRPVARPTPPGDSEKPMYYHDGKDWVPLTPDSLPTYREMVKDMNEHGTAD